MAGVFFGAATASAQAPPPIPALPDAPRLTTYSLSGSTCGCAIGFQLYGDGTDVDAWLQVFISGTPYLSTDPAHGWTITSPTGSLGAIPRPITNAVLTFAMPQSGAVTIVGDRRPRRASQFPENRGVTARDFNQVITDLTATGRELWDKSSRAITGQPGEIFTLLPPATTRIGRTLGFDGSGMPTLLPTFPPGIPPLAASTLSLSSYGAKCDGVTPDDGPIAAWLAATVALGRPGYFSGACLFTTPIVLPAVDGVSIIGDSPQTSILLYAGANTTSDIISVAAGGGQHHGWHFQNWQLKSNTNMTAGAAVHFRQVVRSDLFNWWACTQDCANNFFHGVWFDQVDTMRWCGINAQAKQDVVRINGQVGGPQSDLWLDCGGKISGGQVGVRIGGAFGGFFCQTVDVIANNINAVIDTTLTASANFQIFFQSSCPLDSGGLYDIQVSDTLAVVGSPAYIAFNNGWLASAQSHCMLIDAGVAYPIYFFGGIITNCGASGMGDGVRNNSANVRLVLLGTRVSHNPGIGINSTVNTSGTDAVVFGATDMVGNTGNVNGLTNGIFVQNCVPGAPSGTFAVTLGYVTHC